ncbi:MAG: hypothetical protein AAF720_03195 [Pseudomonadota bacterium]
MPSSKSSETQSPNKPDNIDRAAAAAGRHQKKARLAAGHGAYYEPISHTAETPSGPFMRLGTMLVRTLPKGIKRSLSRFGTDVASASDYLAARPGRRRSAALFLALAVNFIALSLLAIYGRISIFVPNRPADSISIVLVNLPDDPLPIALRDPAIELKPIPEREPEPEPKEIAPETPEPEPKPQPEPEPTPEPIPEPLADLNIEIPDAEDFSIPEADAPAPFIPDPSIGDQSDVVEASPNEETTNDGADEESPDAQEAIDAQTPDDDAPPLVAEEPDPVPADDVDLAEDIGVGDPGADDAEDDGAIADLGFEEMDAGREDESDEEELAELPEGEEQTGTSSVNDELARQLGFGTSNETAEAGDDAFDTDPLAGRRFALPKVDLPSAGFPSTALPEGQTATLPGESGVVAIFCPEEFRNNPEKAKECAGRPEIRSGWRPGASGENFSEAVRLLKADRASGGSGGGNIATFGPEIARKFEQQRQDAKVQDFRRGDDAFNNQARSTDANDGGVSGNRPDFGNSGPEPSWALRDDPVLSQDDLEKLRKDLDEADLERLGQ